MSEGNCYEKIPLYLELRESCYLICCGREHNVAHSSITPGILHTSPRKSFRLKELCGVCMCVRLCMCMCACVHVDPQVCACVCVWVRANTLGKTRTIVSAPTLQDTLFGITDASNLTQEMNMKNKNSHTHTHTHTHTLTANSAYESLDNILQLHTCSCHCCHYPY